MELSVSQNVPSCSSKPKLVARSFESFDSLFVLIVPYQIICACTAERGLDRGRALKAHSAVCGG